MERAAAGEIKGRNQRSVQFVPGVDLAERPSHREILEQHLVDFVAVPFLLGARMRFEVPLPNHQWLGIVRANNDTRTQPTHHTPRATTFSHSHLRVRLKMVGNLQTVHE